MLKFFFSRRETEPVIEETKSEDDGKTEFSQDWIPNIQGGLVAAYIVKGGGKSYQEDSYVVFCSEDKTLTANCVFDGHGALNGQLASRKCAELCWKWFNQEWKNMLTYDDYVWRSTLRRFFLKMHQGIRELFEENEKINRLTHKRSIENIVDGKGVVRDISGYPIRGGTTGTVCIVVNTKEKRQCICANVGDSDALLMPLSQSYLPGDERRNNTHLSVDHSPDSETEFLRVKKLPKSQFPVKLMFVYDSNSVKNKYDCPQVFLYHGVRDARYLLQPERYGIGPSNVRKDLSCYAVTPRGVLKDVTCIAMTRALGDFYGHPFGLTWEPDVSIQKLEPDIEYLVTVASDGVWDCWKFNEFSNAAVAAVRKYPNRLLKATNNLGKRSWKVAKKMYGKKNHDDISLSLLVVPKRY